jgi:hypothetical protein
MEQVDPLVRLVAIEEIRQLKARYFRYMDTKRWDDMREVFARDAHFEPGRFVIRGRDRIAEYMSEALHPLRTVHHGHMPEITVKSPTTASGVWALWDYVEWPVSEGAERQGLYGYGHYEEDYVVEDGAWRIARLLLTRVRVDLLSGGLPDLSWPSQAEPPASVAGRLPDS